MSGGLESLPWGLDVLILVLIVKLKSSNQVVEWLIVRWPVKVSDLQLW